MKSIVDLVENKMISNHCLRVAAYSFALAILAGCSETFAWQIYSAGREHDMGKLFVDPDILNAPRRLTEEEKELVDKHTSPEFLDKCEFSTKLAREVAGDHHKHFNQVSLATQIVAVADVFDALTAPRTYSREVNGVIQGFTKNGLSAIEAFDVMATDPRQDNLNENLVIMFSDWLIRENEQEY